jgi:NAD(P)H-hydrate epimerase
MITADRLEAVETNAIALGVSAKQLMESRENAVAHGVRDLADGEANVTVVAGRGDSGGNALAAARFLSGCELTVALLGRPETITTAVARENWEVLAEADYDVDALVDSADVDFGAPDVIVDESSGPDSPVRRRNPNGQPSRRSTGPTRRRSRSASRPGRTPTERRPTGASSPPTVS